MQALAYQGTDHGLTDKLQGQGARWSEKNAGFMPAPCPTASGVRRCHRAAEECAKRGERGAAGARPAGARTRNLKLLTLRVPPVQHTA
jgi:hypothetical protein